MKKYLRKFPTIVDYEAYKNNPDEFLVPSISYVEEVASCSYDPMPEVERILHPVIHAKFNATSENMTAFQTTSQIKALKIDGNVIEFEPLVSETVVIETLGSEITITSDGLGVYPSNYTHNYSSLTIQPADTTLKCTDFEYVAILIEMDGMQAAVPLPIADAIVADYLKLDEQANIISVREFTSTGATAAGCVFMTLNEDTGEINAIDTTCTFTITSGGLESPYMFETEGEHEVEIEFVDNGDITGIFTQTCISEISYMKDVVSIGTSAFLEAFSLTTVVLGDDLKTINAHAFESCQSLSSINIPDSVTYIGFEAFYDCRSLTSITIPDSVTEIGERAFEYCETLTSIDLGNGITSIGEGTFYGCDSLTSITIPEGVTSIGHSAFSHCLSLASINIPEGVTSIDDTAFSNCTSLTSIVIPDSVTEIGVLTFHGCSSLTSVTIPDSVTSINFETFKGCTQLAEFNGNLASADKRCLLINGKLIAFAPAGLTSYVIPNEVTSIDEYAFNECTNLSSITIPDSVTSIGKHAFYNCTNLVSIDLGNGIKTISSYAFYNCSSLASITIPEGITSIGSSVFYGCKSLTSITIPEGVTSIGFNMFSDCESLTSITIPNSVTYIGNSALYRCTSLTSVTIPDSVTSIDRAVFMYCTSLTEITIPDSVTSIGGSVFYGCTRLTSVYCKATTPPAGNSDMFKNNASARKIYVPMASVEAYKSADGWSDYADAIVGYNF